MQQNSSKLITYFVNMAVHHYSRQMIKDKNNRENKIKYYRCWVEDMKDVLEGHDININQFKQKLNEFI